MRRYLSLAAVAMVVGCGTPPPAPAPPADTASAETITPARVREHTQLEWALKADKMRRHLIPAMRAHGVTLWVIMSRENAVDPALELFGGSGITGWYGHRNAYLFYDRGGDAANALETTVYGTHLPVTCGGFMTPCRVRANRA